MLEQKKYNIMVLVEGKTERLTCDTDTVLMDALSKNDVFLDAPCGGKGLCGKCKVKVQGNGVSPVHPDEEKNISKVQQQEGIRLACKTVVQGDMEVILDTEKTANIMTAGTAYAVDALPIVKKKFIEIDKPTVKDQRDDAVRVMAALNKQDMHISLPLLRILPQKLRENDYELTVVYNDSEVISIEPGNTQDAHYGIGVDIGTTTVVAYLLDLASGKQVGVSSRLNAQKSFGADVISRITHTIQQEEGLEQLKTAIIKQLNTLINELVVQNNLVIERIYAVLLAGNTTMMHLLAGISPRHIATAPFIPVSTQEQTCRAKELGLHIHENGLAYLLPSVSAYVGADIVAAINASEMLESDTYSLLVDIGTNGEIALGNKEKIVCCSTAAGPAFEGAHIKYGVGGISGAINKVCVKGNELKYYTIGDSKPIGICGSGIVDIVSVLIDLGIIDETGRIVDEDEIEIEKGMAFRNRIIEEDDIPAFVIVDAKQSANGQTIVITQKDIREIQLAKAAIAAGINILIKHVGISVEEISAIYLAGGFGSFMDKDSAANIGLIPKQLKDKVVALGNAAGSGAMMSMISTKYYERCNIIKNMTGYVDLSSTTAFQDEYVKGMYFEKNRQN